MTERTVANILQDLRQSQQSYLDILDGLDEGLIHQQADDEWTVATVLAHLNEARQFYASEVQKVLAAPGIKMGRTVEHEGRQQAIGASSQTSVETLRKDIVASYQSLVTSLMKMTDDDLQLQGEHVVAGPQLLLDFIEQFIVNHDQVHIGQSTELLSKIQ